MNPVLLVKTEHALVLARTLAPRFAGQDDGPLMLDGNSESEIHLGGVPGKVASESGHFGGARVVRDVFRANDGSFVGIRMSVINATDAPLELRTMVPLHCETSDAFRAVGAPLGEWRIVRMSRQKNDIPGNFRFTDDDIDYEHARMDASEYKVGLGILAEDATAVGDDSNAVQADPFLWVKHRDDDAVPGLFVGVLGQTEHLSQILIRCTDDRRSLQSLSVRCDFDGVTVAPGETRSTHWVLLWEAVDEESMRQRYIELLAAEMNVPPPATEAPSYFCSWYFYGTDFTQADLEENLAELKKRPIPFDIFMIDDGWMDRFGDYNADEHFPAGMQHAAELIRAAGYRPGIWTCPFVIAPESAAIKKYPTLIARDDRGEPILFPYEKTKMFVVDPTSADAEPYLAELFTKLRSWGFTAHKLDFLRCIVTAPQLRFHDRTKTRAQAYRLGMTMIRRIVGRDGFILACGGLFEGSAGLVDAVRIGADTKGRWGDPNATTAYHRMGYVVRIKQNVFRNHTNRLWHTDPDALQLRRRDQPFRGRDEFFHLCQGSFTDDEAMSIVVQQYLGGGIVCLCERMAELPDDRYALLRRALPTVTPPAKIVDFEHPECPTTFWTKVSPPWPGMAAWATLVVFNWGDAPVAREMHLSSIPFLTAEPRLAVMEMVTQSFLGIYSGRQSVGITVPRHGTRVLRVATWDGSSPVLLGTDSHFSGGAAEFESFNLLHDRVKGRLRSRWQFPINVTLGLPERGQLQPIKVVLPSNRQEFSVPFPAANLIGSPTEPSGGR